MKDPRPWIALLAVVCFLAGMAAGVLATRRPAVSDDGSPFGDYAARLVEEFDLSGERAAHLRVILREYAAEIERIERAQQAQYYAALEPELRPKGIEFNSYVREKVIPRQQRARFDALAAGLPVSPRFPAR